MAVDYKIRMKPVDREALDVLKQRTSLSWPQAVRLWRVLWERHLREGAKVPPGLDTRDDFEAP